MNKREKHIAKRARHKQEEAEVRARTKRWAQKKEDLRSAYTGLAMYSMIALLCAFMSGWCWPRFRANHLISPRDWGRTTGTMRTISVGYSFGRNGGWWLRGTYCYQVGEQQLTGSRLGFNLNLSEVGVESFYKHHQPPAPVTVFYEKGNPEFSTLYLPEEDKNQEAAVSMSILGLLLLIFVGRAVV